MSWINRLTETYDSCTDFIGVPIDNVFPLLPLAHITQNAHIEIALHEDGSFWKAEAVTKSKVKDERGREITIIPCTEDSASRAGKAEFPHPLCDKLQYVAGDYEEYGGTKGCSSHQKYLEQLKAWCDSPHACKEVKIVFSYLSKGTVVSDLIAAGLFVGGEDKTVPIVWSEGLDLSTEPLESFVRFAVHIAGEQIHKVWESPEVWQSYINYLLDSQSQKDLCYVTGELIPCADKHPAKLRHTGDKAKLVSANDTSGYTFRGRFTDDAETVRVGFLPSQKAHSALRWLVARQGLRNGEQSIVIWGNQKDPLPIALNDTDEVLKRAAQVDLQDDFFDYTPDISFEPPQTEDELAKRIRSCMLGYWKQFDNEYSTAVIMAVDAATVGRLSITYYRELTGSRYLEKLKSWHTSCAWLHNYKREFKEDQLEPGKKPKVKAVIFYGAPAPTHIAEAAYGRNCSDKLKKATVERLMPCIIDEKPLPYDILQSVVRQASRCAEIENYDWEKALSIACALIKKYRYDMFKEEWTVNLDTTLIDRSYLYGRLLAIAHEIESWALYDADTKRETAAERMMHQFSKTPYKTWANIRKSLAPYQKRLGEKADYLVDMLNEVSDMLSVADYTNTNPLENVWLLGYSSQRKVFIDERNKRFAAAKEKKLKANESATNNEERGE